MAKKKNRAKRTRQVRSTQVNQITAQDREQGRAAIMTMVKGAVMLAVFICFFALKIQDKTMYERAQGIFADEAPAQSAQSANQNTKQSAK